MPEEEDSELGGGGGGSGGSSEMEWEDVQPEGGAAAVPQQAEGEQGSRGNATCRALSITAGGAGRWQPSTRAG